MQRRFVTCAGGFDPHPCPSPIGGRGGNAAQGGERQKSKGERRKLFFAFILPTFDFKNLALHVL